MTSERPGLVPVLGDARKHAAWGVLLPTKVPWLFQDVAQAGQWTFSSRHVSAFCSPVEQACSP